MDTITNLCNEIAEKIPRVYEKGKKDEHDAFWDEALSAGSSSSIARFAGRCWTINNFKPNNDITLLSNCNYAFYNSGISADLIDLAEELGINITIKPTAMALQMFTFSTIKGVKIDFTELVGIASVFTDATHLERVIMKLKENGTNVFNSTFNGCTKLKYLTIESGYIGSSVSFASSPIDGAYMANILENSLMHYNGTSNDMKYTITISQSTWNELQNIEVPQMMGSWETFIQYKGWNVQIGGT